MNSWNHVYFNIICTLGKGKSKWWTCWWSLSTSACVHWITSQRLSISTECLQTVFLHTLARKQFHSHSYSSKSQQHKHPAHKTQTERRSGSTAAVRTRGSAASVWSSWTAFRQHQTPVVFVLTWWSPAKNTAVSELGESTQQTHQTFPQKIPDLSLQKRQCKPSFSEFVYKRKLNCAWKEKSKKCKRWV